MFCPLYLGSRGFHPAASFRTQLCAYTRCKTPPLEASTIKDLRIAEMEKQRVQSYCLQLVLQRSGKTNVQQPHRIHEKVFKSSERNLSKATSSSLGMSGTRTCYSVMTKCASSVQVQGTEGRNQARGKHCLLQHIKHWRARKPEVQTAQHLSRYLTPSLAWERPFQHSEQLHLIRQAHSLKCLGSAADHRAYSAASLQVHRAPK